MRLLSLLLAASFIAVPLAARADDGAATLLAKHKAFMGWDGADSSMASWNLTERHTYTHGTTTVTSTGHELRDGLVYRETVTAEDSTSSDDGFTGRVFWSSNINGFVHPRLGDVVKALVDDDLIRDEGLGSIAGATVTGHSSIDGVQTTIVHLQPQAGFPMDVYVDPNTGAFKRVIVDPDGHAYRAVYDVVKYMDVGNGRKFVGSYRWNGSQWDVTEFKTAAVALSDLHPPQPSASWTFNGDVSAPIEYVSHTYSGNSLVVHASINGHEGRFLLDSGASGIILYDGIAKNARVHDLGNTSYIGVAGNTVKATKALVDTLAIGTDTLHHVVVTHSRNSGSGLDGILGYDLLANAIVDVDLAKHLITIHDPSAYQPQVTPGAYAFPVDLQTLTPGVTINLPGNVVAHPTFDSGDDFFVTLADRLRSNAHIVALDDSVDTQYGTIEMRPYFEGVDGEIEASRCVRLNRIEVGPYPYEKAPLCFTDSSIFGDDGGLIGFDFLKHFNWTFDYPHNSLILTPNNL